MTSRNLTGTIYDAAGDPLDGALEVRLINPTPASVTGMAVGEVAYTITNGAVAGDPALISPARFEFVIRNAAGDELRRWRADVEEDDADVTIQELYLAAVTVTDVTPRALVVGDLVTLMSGGGTVGYVLTQQADGSIAWAAAGGGAVDSVNGQTGVVLLDAGDVGADPAGTAATAVATEAAARAAADTTEATTRAAADSALSARATALEVHQIPVMLEVFG